MLRLAIAITLLLAAAASHAQAPGWYIVGAGGQLNSRATTEVDGSSVAALGVTPIASSDSSTSTSLSIGGGYTFSRYFALEASYVDLGTVHEQSTTYQRLALPARDANVSRTWDLSGFELAAIGAWPIGNFSLLGKASVYSLKGKYQTNSIAFQQPGNVQILGTSDSSSGSATVPAIGLGVRYSFAERFSVRAMYEAWGDKSGLFGPSSNDLKDMRLFTIGLQFHL